MSLLFQRRPVGARRDMDMSMWIRGIESQGGWRALSGESVQFNTVIGLDAVAACVGLLSDVVYMLPVDVFRDRAGVADPVTPPAFVARPSLKVSARVWRAQAMVSWLLWGNAYGMVLERDELGRPKAAEWLDPAAVEAREDGALDRVRFFVSGVEVPADRILHVPGRYVRPGSAIGVAPLERFKETFGLALAARNFGARWFGEGAHPSAILEAEGAVSQEAAQTIKERFLQAVRGKREPAVLGAGVKYRPIQVNPAESQMSESQDRAVVAVARSFGLPPEMVAAAMSGSSVTYANREQRAIDFLTFSANPWLVRFEDMWSENIARPQYARFNRSALLRTDTPTRYRAHDSAIRAGWLSRNDVRRLEDLPPIADGDEYLWPPYAVSLDRQEVGE